MDIGNRDQTCNCYKSERLSETILESTQILNFHDRYKLGEQLGWGQFGIIRECVDMLTGEVLACKSINKDRLVSPEDVKSVKLEIEIMRKLAGHPNVVDLKAVYEEENYVHLVMELCAGGELFHQIEKHGRFTEHEARVLFRHLMQVIVFCHGKGIVHRDLKPENILLVKKSSSSPIKLADFGLATYITPGQKLNGTVGSPFYIAPEVLVGGYNQAADVWSAGVILYILLSGMPPFWGKTKSKIFDAVRAANLWFPYDPWDNVSSSAKDLITGMLFLDPSKRLTANQVLAHSWIQNEEAVTIEESFINIQSSNTHFMERSEDYSFKYSSPANLGDSPIFTCQSSFSSFLVENGNPPCPVVAAGAFSFSTYPEESNNLEFPSTIPSMPSFTFFTSSSTIKQEKKNKNSLEGEIANTFDKPELLLLLADKRLEIRRVGGSKNLVGKHNKRNNTIGLGELDQLDLVVTESVIRWVSCTHIPSCPSLRSSLVC
ncbi:calcium-dependent protein kinase 26-like [Impatiens glandulifera]|uniref:calcium-dependent protein kinase 26-like n=1 Tax=Impatiens glandulifera TaxID=253017 RepID=UPI001FB080EB|nr:calcium-dependent protein kinase 26-like [Impatiens glandulifera]